MSNDVSDRVRTDLPWKYEDEERLGNDLWFDAKATMTEVGVDVTVMVGAVCTLTDDGGGDSNNSSAGKLFILDGISFGERCMLSKCI